MQIIYIGKAEDGGYWHLIVTKFSIHVYRRFRDSKGRYRTVRIASGLLEIASMLKLFPKKVREFIKDLIANHPFMRKLQEIALVVSKDAFFVKTVLRMAKDMCLALKKLLDWMDEKLTDERLRKQAMIRLRMIQSEIETEWKELSANGEIDHSAFHYVAVGGINLWAIADRVAGLIDQAIRKLGGATHLNPDAIKRSRMLQKRAEENPDYY